MQWQRLTTETKFVVDKTWWERTGRDFRLFLWDQLCPECREQIPSHVGTREVDWIDPETAEVKKTDAILQCMRTLCIPRPDWIHRGLPLMTAIFRAFIMNDYRPMSAEELHEYIPWRTPEFILAALKAAQREWGIFPVWAVEDVDLVA